LRLTHLSANSPHDVTTCHSQPASADGATREVWPKFASDLRTHFGPSQWYSRRCWPWPGTGGRSREAGNKLIIACGGDGTISEVANGILDSTGNRTWILPGGTGSDFRRSLRMPPTRAAARALRDGRTRTIDVARVAFVTTAESARRVSL